MAALTSVVYTEITIHEANALYLLFLQEKPYVEFSESMSSALTSKRFLSKYIFMQEKILIGIKNIW